MPLIQKKINLLIAEIQKYTNDNPELWKCHHFLFDKPLNGKQLSGKLDFLVMAMNPGETAMCRKMFPRLPNTAPLEESSRHNQLVSDTPEKSSANWQKKCNDILGPKNIVLGDMFFWSTPKDRDVSKLFSKVQLDKHYSFCSKVNRVMIEIRQPKVIVFPGMLKESKAVRLYDLKPTARNHIMDIHNRGKLISFWSYGSTPWVFTKHWSGARLSNKEKNIITDELKTLVDS